jgi:MoxR-like ATPase
MFRRVQCTPDLLPSELTGVSVFHLAGNEWEFRPGPLFAHVVLVDELNRATPRTQSALLEAMEERQVTVDGVSRALPHPFFLVATQNPYETTGTFPLVEGQLDRFTVVTHIGPPDAATERELLLGAGGEDALADLTPVSDPVVLADAISTVRRIHCEPAVADYVIALANATRAHPEVAIGASPRASLALLHAAQAYALLAGRSYVVPDDVKHLAIPVLAHRLLLRDAATLREAQAFLSRLVEGVAVPHP